MRADVARLIELGFDVFPCYGVNSAKVKQPKTLGRDWRDGPPEGGWQWADDDLIGVNLPLGTVVVDVDDPDRFRESGLDLPNTVATFTRREGGIHAFYRTSAPAPQVTDKERGFDTRVGGLGYVIAWDPSLWTATSEWSTAPSFVFDKPIRMESATGPGATMVTRLDILSFLGRLALQGNLAKDDYYRLLIGRREKGLLVDGDPRRPWTDEDLRELANEAAKWPAATREPQLLERGEQGDRIVVITDYLRNVPETIPWIVDKFAYLHGVTILAGSPKAGKSTLAFDLMRAREEGGSFLGGLCHAGPTLLVTEEGGVPIRYKGAGLTDLYVYDRQASQGDPFDVTLRVLGKWAEAHPEGLIFIDTLAVWASVEDENSSAEMTKAITLVRQLLAEPFNVAVILIHHTRKGGGSFGEAIRGSGAILASVDHVIELNRVSEEGSTERKLDIMSRVLPAEERMVIDWNPETRMYSRVEAPPMTRKADRELARVPFDGPGMTYAELEAIGLSEYKVKNWVRSTYMKGTWLPGKAPVFWRNNPGVEADEE